MGKWNICQSTYLSIRYAGRSKENILQQRYVYQLVRFPKTTPDYLPIYKETKDNKYDRYNEEILENETTFIKTHPGGLLTIKWKNTGDKTVHIPVIVYDRTVLQQNGKTLTDYEVTDIGTPIVKQQKGINELTLHYQTPIYFYFILSLTLIGWFTLLCLFIYHRYKLLHA